MRQDGDDDEDGDSRALQQCALRELFEETGVLLDGGIADAVDADERDAARTAMLGGDEAAAQDAWASLSARSSGGASLTEICRIKTPTFAPVRYDTVFFLAELPEGEAPDIRTGELIDGGFTTPERALEKWRKGDCMIVPPVLMLLGLLRGGDLPSFLPRRRRRRRRLPARQAAPGVLLPWNPDGLHRDADAGARDDHQLLDRRHRPAVCDRPGRTRPGRTGAPVRAAR